MATTKVIKDLTEFNPGNPDYVLNATNAVTVINSGGNQYNFNGVYGKFGLRIGTTVLTGVPSAHPIAVLNNGLTGITYTGTVNEGTLAVGGITYTFYSGDVTITVTTDFGVASYYCKIHGYMGGQDNLVSVYSEAGLRMPTGGAFSGTPAEGMMRNDDTQDSQGSASTMQHYTGDNVWKNFVNLANPPATFNIDYLVVGGGGGGGGNEGGGGGAGAYIPSYNSEVGGGSVPATGSTGRMSRNIAYTVTVGEGGLPGTQGPSEPDWSKGFNGNSSVLNFEGRGAGGAVTETAIGGGGGGTGISFTAAVGDNIYVGANGASGGGGSRGNANNPAPRAGGSATGATSGFNGGSSDVNGNTDSSGGGGGAFGLGSSATTGGGYDGGNDSAVSGRATSGIDGTNTPRGGGGGGGGYTGAPSIGAGTQGGGNGGTDGSSQATAGTANTGGGGGGGAGSGTDAQRVGGQGGSGVVIIRYATSEGGSFSVTGTLNTPTPVIIGTDSVITFTTGTGTITFI